jgi:hypothetical protein
MAKRSQRDAGQHATVALTREGVKLVARNITLRLIGADVPDGEIAVADLSDLMVAMQELSTRTGRELSNHTGPGRTSRSVEEFAQLRLRGITTGSTTLMLNKGTFDKLDLDVREENQRNDRFWEVIAAIGEDRRPDWTTDLIAESAGKFVAAIQRTAQRAEVSEPGRRAVEIRSQEVRAETWATERRQLAGAAQTVSGRLEKADLRSHAFRVRDDIGHVVDLRQVGDDETAAQLIGRWVIAHGTGVVSSSGRLLALEDTTIEKVDDPTASYADVDVVDLDEILASAPGPQQDDGIDLSEDEFAAFLAAASS